MSLGLLMTLIAIIVSGMKYFSESSKTNKKADQKNIIIVPSSDEVQEIVKKEEIGQRSSSDRQVVSRSTINESRVTIETKQYQRNMSSISDENSPIFTPEDFKDIQLVKNIIFTEILSVPKSKR